MWLRITAESGPKSVNQPHNGLGGFDKAGGFIGDQVRTMVADDT